METVRHSHLRKILVNVTAAYFWYFKKSQITFSLNIHHNVTLMIVQSEASVASLALSEILLQAEELGAFMSLLLLFTLHVNANKCAQMSETAIN